MHGFNQGSTFLIELCGCNMFDVIYVQEHWTPPALMDRILNISDNYVGFRISAMETVVFAGFLKWRPWGGTAMLVKKCFTSVGTDIYIFERVVATKMLDVFSINCYLPYED